MKVTSSGRPEVHAIPRSQWEPLATTHDSATPLLRHRDCPSFRRDADGAHGTCTRTNLRKAGYAAACTSKERAAVEHLCKDCGEPIVGRRADALYCLICLPKHRPGDFTAPEPAPAKKEDNHMDSHYHCDICDKDFAKPQGLALHNTRVHAPVMVLEPEPTPEQQLEQLRAIETCPDSIAELEEDAATLKAPADLVARLQERARAEAESEVTSWDTIRDAREETQECRITLLEGALGFMPDELRAKVMDEYVHPLVDVSERVGEAIAMTGERVPA